MLDLLHDGVTVATVRHLLVRFYGFYEPWERRVAAVMPPHLTGFFGARRKCPLLEADLLAHLGPGMNLGEVPRCDRLPDVSVFSRALGSMYVLEGSTLGGQIVSRHLAKVPGLEREPGRSFFASYGPDVGRMWREFQDVLRGHSSPSTDDATVTAASETFVALYDWVHDRAGDFHH